VLTRAIWCCWPPTTAMTSNFFARKLPGDGWVVGVGVGSWGGGGGEGQVEQKVSHN
jgi:hypothetical protein